jgi:hypothetical protein
MVLTFDVPQRDRVTAWVIRAFAPGEDLPDNLGSLAGGTSLSNENPPVRILLAGEEFGPGVHNLIWDCRDGWGKELPDGLYRLYLVAPKMGYHWHDLMLTNCCDE